MFFKKCASFRCKELRNKNISFQNVFHYNNLLGKPVDPLSLNVLINADLVRKYLETENIIIIMYRKF